MKKLTGLGLLSLVGLVALTGFAGGCGHHRGGGDPAKMAAMITEHVEDTLDDLKATPDQRARILAVKDRLLAEATALHATRQADRAEVLAQWNAATPDRAKLHALVDQRIEAMRAMAHQAVDAGIEVHDVLTAEQRAQVAKKAERFHRP
jgi:periplasmic protein CpxP/Spy